ncbi:hypothetical protein IQ276_037490 [Desmonostoc muscorum LEGE 12446]|uniref:Uncharacterized protein n=1 Tax=Desmonostoc muscorum LEGE 12446 TaxID=1828758 RepID=A0A8J6ZLB7_DESMC|nr:hypothetical protein [Desmonostoc muscorum]MCF2152004.1 hypothetical protein [Desmonostoc muscorum LEGE 12446]
MTPIAHISSTFGSKRENNWLRFALRAMSTTGCPVSLLSHPQISLLSTPLPATMFCDPLRKKLKVADDVCNTLACTDF